MEIIKQDGITIVILEGGEDLANDKVDSTDLIVRRPLKCSGWYYVIRNRYGPSDLMLMEAQFNAAKQEVIKTRGFKQHLLVWHNVRHKETHNTGWEAISIHCGPNIGGLANPIIYRYYPEINNDKIVWRDYSSFLFSALPSIFETVEELKKMCQEREDVYSRNKIQKLNSIF